MASVLVQIDGVIWDDAEKAGKKVTIYGQMFRPDLSVGGGPIYPPDKPPGSPPGIWGGPIDPYPDHGLPGPQPHPEHPIVLPPVPPETEPKWALKAVWVPNVGWVTVIVPIGGQPIPTPSK